MSRQPRWAIRAHAFAGSATRLVHWTICRLAFPDLNIQPEGFAVVGMAAFFTGVVRAPLTGIVLVTEMTASVTMLLPCWVHALWPCWCPSFLTMHPSMICYANAPYDANEFAKSETSLLLGHGVAISRWRRWGAATLPKMIGKPSFPLPTITILELDDCAS